MNVEEFKRLYDLEKSNAFPLNTENKVVVSVTLSRLNKLGLGTQVILPYNLNIDYLVVHYPPENFGFNLGLDFDPTKIYLILGLLSSIPARNKDLIVEDHFIPINAEALNSYMKDYNLYLDYLRYAGVIERDRESEFVEGKSRRYRWTEQYIQSNFVRVDIPKFIPANEVQRAKILEQIRNDIEKNLANYPQYITHWYKENKLRFDFNTASHFALALRNYKLANPDKWDWNRDKNTPKSPYNQYAAIISNLDSIVDGDYKLQIDDHVHRLHSVLTNMQKEFRNFLTYDGQEMVSIDIKNSQPYLSCILFNTEFWSENSTLDLNLNELPQNIIESIRFTPPRANAISIITALNRLFERLEGHEFDRYKSIVSSGAMYETIMQWIKDEEGETIKRDDAKTIIFKLFFSPNRTNPEDENLWLMLYFKDKFPQVVELFKIIKKQYQGLDEKKQHGRLACLLQSIESEIILHRYCERIWNEKNHQVPIFTIHDSIATTIENKDYVKRVMEEELTRAIGVTPRLSEEYWKTEALQEKYPNLLASQSSSNRADLERVRAELERL